MANWLLRGFLVAGIFNLALAGAQFVAGAEFWWANGAIGGVMLAIWLYAKG